MSVLEAIKRYDSAIKVWSFNSDAKQRSEFYTVMADSARDGMAQMDVLQKLRKHLDNGSGLAIVLDKLFLRIRGVERSSARSSLRTIGTELVGLLPDAEVAMISAGEFSGSIESGWRNAAKYAQGKDVLRKAVMKSMTFPIIYFLAFTGLLLFFSYNLLPQFEANIPRENWPAMAQQMGWVADNVLILVGGAGGLVLFLVALFSLLGKRWTGAVRERADRSWPVFGLMAQVSGANFMLAMASFVGSGISFGEALERMRVSATPYMLWQLRQMERLLRKGQRPEEAMVGSSLLAKRYHWLVAIYGGMAAADAALAYERIAQGMSDRTKEYIERAFGMYVANAMLLLLAFGIFVIYFSMFGIATAGADARV